MGVRIVTDSACDLTRDVTDALDIGVVPLTIRFGADEYVDRDELSVEDFYAKMATFDDLPQTAAPAPGAFEAMFRKVLDEGADSIVCINLSGGLSATGQAALTAAQTVRDVTDVRCLDSRTITAGLGTVVTAAADAAQQGASTDDVVALVEDLSERTHVFGILDTLDNLKKGGRIGGAKAMLGTMLSIKPCLDLSSGTVEEAGRQRTRKRAIDWLLDTVAQAGDIEHVAVAHGMAPDLDEFLDRVSAIAEVDRVDHIGAVIGTHAGPRVLGVAYCRAR